MNKKKYHRYVYKVEVLSEKPLPYDLSFSDIDYEITEGDCSGEMLEPEHEEVDGKKMAKLLIDQGSDPGFFRLTEDGEEF